MGEWVGMCINYIGTPWLTSCFFFLAGLRFLVRILGDLFIIYSAEKRWEISMKNVQSSNSKHLLSKYYICNARKPLLKIPIHKNTLQRCWKMLAREPNWQRWLQTELQRLCYTQEEGVIVIEDRRIFLYFEKYFNCGTPCGQKHMAMIWRFDFQNTLTEKRNGGRGIVFDLSYPDLRIFICVYIYKHIYLYMCASHRFAVWGPWTAPGARAAERRAGPMAATELFGWMDAEKAKSAAKQSFLFENQYIYNI